MIDEDTLMRSPLLLSVTTNMINAVGEQSNVLVLPQHLLRC